MPRLGINIDHIATIRNARGGVHPCPIDGAKMAEKFGADGITAHLREDRRHVRDEDIYRLKEEVNLPLNMEMAATQEMLDIALKVKPNACCLVPEKREELTTEGGLNVAENIEYFKEYADRLKQAKILVSLFIDPDFKQLEAAKEIGADIIELHTGNYCATIKQAQKDELQRIIQAATYAEKLEIECHAGHGLTFANVRDIAIIPQIIELNIGHFIIGEAIFTGLEDVMKKMRKEMGAA